MPLVDANLSLSDVQGLEAQGAAVWQEVRDAGGGDLKSILALGTLLAQNVPLGDAVSAVKGAVDVAQGALAGASAGSVIPGYGTVIGAAVGAVLAGVQDLMSAQAHPSDPDPAWLQVARAIPGPNNPDGSTPTDVEQAAAKDLWQWQAARFAHLADWMSIDQNHAKAAELWDYPSDPTRGQVVIELGGSDAAITAMSRFARWVEPVGSIWLPDGALQPMQSTYGQSDRYGWALALGVWAMAVQGNSDLDALHWFLMHQWIVHAKGGPEPEPHLATMIGRLSVILAQANVGHKSLAQAMADRFTPSHMASVNRVVVAAGKKSSTPFLFAALGAGGGALAFGPVGAAAGALLGYVAARRVST